MEPPRGDSPATPPMAELLAAAVGVSLQLATTGTVATVAGAMVPPALMAAWRLDQATFAPRLARAGRTIAVASEELGLAVPEIERLSQRDEATTSLVGRVLAASANAATAREKVDALGRVLAKALGDEDRVDEALMLARALDDLEAPHVRTLAALGFRSSQPDARTGEHWWFARIPSPDRDHTLSAFTHVAGGEHVASAVLGVLTRHGLVRQETRTRPDPQYLGERNAPPLRENVWGITELGTICLNLLDVPSPVGDS